MSNIEIPRGVILVPDKDGKNVPFLIKVRDKDVVWTDTDKTKERVRNVAIRKYDKLTVVSPKESYHVSKDGWSCDIRSDGYTVMTRRIPIDNNFRFNLDNYNHLLEYNGVELPLFIILGNTISVQTSIIQDMAYIKDETNTDINQFHIGNVSDGSNTIRQYLLAATTSTSFNYKPIKYDIPDSSAYYYGYDKINIYLYSPLEIPTNFYSSNNASVSIEIRGYIPIVFKPDYF